MKRFALLPLFLSTCTVFAQQVSLIPEPVEMKTQEGKFILGKNTVLVTGDEQDSKTAKFFNDYLKTVYRFRLNTVKKPTGNFIRFFTKRMLVAGVEGKYDLTVSPKSIQVSGETGSGTFYGMQTLIQLLPVVKSNSLAVPAVSIMDYPLFTYRGLMLDVCRHYFPVSFVKRYIDYIAMAKLNTFHWHLTDDQGWRIEIKKYPLLTKTGSCRNGTIIGHYPGTGNDSIRTCGFYTQNEIRDVIKYAADRFVTIVPEIEMPGHASAALTAYPYLGCTGGPYHVQGTWGVFKEVFCAGNDSTFQFMQDVVDEVMALFPSKFIHVGGDECPKESWKVCPKCQKRIKDLGLKDEHELQSYFINRMEKYINSKGKNIIGWDEILEGGLAPNATVMSWRGEKGGIEAARQHHRVIMTPTTYVYLDYAQKKNEDSLVIGGYLPLEKVYNYEPLPAELTEEEKKYITGVQANVWTEYMTSPAKVEYMIFPRVTALSEVYWSPKEKKDWNNFQRKLPVQFKRFELQHTNYSKAYYDLKATISPSPGNDGVLWTLETKRSGKEYTLYTTTENLEHKKSMVKVPDFNDGKNGLSGRIKDSTVMNDEYTEIYTSPVFINKTRTYYATLRYTCPGCRIQEAGNIKQSFFINKATGKKITITGKPPQDNWAGNGGAFGLINGAMSEKGLISDEWLGWLGQDLEAVIDLGKEEDISSVNLHVYDQLKGRYYHPVLVIVSTSGDGEHFEEIGKTAEFKEDHDNMGNMTATFSPAKTRYLKILAKNFGLIPEGSVGAGTQARMLIDEIQVK